MRSYDVPEEAIKIDPRDFSIKNRLKPEYVLKVNNVASQNKSQVKSVEPKSNPNPGNLPAVVKRKSSFGKKAILYTLFFFFIFMVAVVVGYNAVFYLFTI